MNEELLKLALQEIRHRENCERQVYSETKNEGYLWAAVAYNSAAWMLEYALKGDGECLAQFLTFYRELE